MTVKNCLLDWICRQGHLVMLMDPLDAEPTLAGSIFFRRFPPYDIMETGLPFTADWTVSGSMWHIVLPHASPQECQWQSSERTFRLLSSLPALSLPIWPPITLSVPQSLFSSFWVLPLMMKGWSEGYRASKHVHGGYVGMVKLVYVCVWVSNISGLPESECDP